jgi:hypothetical protein
MADHEAEVPERMQDGADDALFGVAEAAAEEQKEIDVGVKRKLPASIAADGDERDGLLNPRRGGDELPQDGVEPIREAYEGRAPAMPAENLITELAARVAEGGRRRKY